jgi:hypothetical protein
MLGFHQYYSHARYNIFFLWFRSGSEFTLKALCHETQNFLNAPLMRYRHTRKHMGEITYTRETPIKFFCGPRRGFLLVH